jgi:nucleotide-binding universal stress UspA family protein
VAAEMGISRPCASKWVNLRRRHSVAGLLDRSSTPRRSLVATPAWVVGVDGSPSSIAALRIARSLTATRSTHVRLVTAWQVPSSAEDVYGSEVVDDEAAKARRLQQEAVGEAFDGHPPDGYESVVTEGDSATVLIEEGSSASMIVVGSRGHGTVAGLLMGSVSAACAEHATCPAPVVR